MKRRAPPPGGRVLALTLVLALVTVVVPGCSSRLTRVLSMPDAGPPPAMGSLKGHLRNGDVLLFDHWRFDEATRIVSGAGVRLDPFRHEIARGTISIPLDSVALFETNVVHRGMPVAVLAASVVTGVFAGLCVVNPKACFGSCPTFYLDAGAGWKLVAESFSASVLPSLEASDVDALPGVRPSAGIVDLRMTNEAQETHVVRAVDLLYAPRPSGGRVWATPEGDFVTTGMPVSPAGARGPEGDCLAAVSTLDGRERTSAVDAMDLSAHEELEFEFAHAPAGELGLVLSTRQSLLSTFLFYQGLAWLGTKAGSWLAQVERSGATAGSRFGSLEESLGHVAIVGEQSGSAPWTVEQTPFETGPLAVDTRVILLGQRAARPGDVIRIRLRLTRGYTRIDRIAIVGVRGSVTPQRIRPFDVLRSGTSDDAALRDLLDPDRSLVTLPGDTCTIRYCLPAPAAQAPDDYEWFLEGRGYYLEWMRQEWLAEEDPWRLQQLLRAPQEGLRALAPAYARGEAEREAMFWRSRYAPSTR